MAHHHLGLLCFTRGVAPIGPLFGHWTSCFLFLFSPVEDCSLDAPLNLSPSFWSALIVQFPPFPYEATMLPYSCGTSCPLRAVKPLLSGLFLFSRQFPVDPSSPQRFPFVPPTIWFFLFLFLVETKIILNLPCRLLYRLFNNL